MENEKLGQESAYPCKEYLWEDGIKQSYNMPGMSKRFYAACAAMQGILSNHELRTAILLDSKQESLNHHKKTPQGYLVEQAYIYADELLKQE